MSATFRCVRALCLLAPLFALAARGQQLSIDLDQQKTQVAFVLTDVLHTVHGNFQLKQGHISIDPVAKTMSGDIVVDAASGISGNATRDKRMTRDVLQAQKFPEIRFAPTAYSGALVRVGTSAVEVTGSFSIHGDSHKITIPMQFQLDGKEAAASGKFSVPYVQWGMKSPSNFLLKVQDMVEIDLTAAGHIRPSAP